MLAVECVLLWWGQRRLFWLVEGTLGSRALAYVVAAPGTVLHELAHYVMCVVLRVPVGRQVGRRVELFRPRRGPDGSVRLGSVPHAKTDPLRGALIAVAPVLLVPAMLLGATLLLLGDGIARDPRRALEQASTWAVVVWAVLMVSAGQAAFPSPGDRIGVLGGAALLALAALAVGAAVLRDSLEDVVRLAAGVLVLPALAVAVTAAVTLVVTRVR